MAVERERQKEAALPPIGSTVEVGDIRLVRRHRIGRWVIIAEAVVKGAAVPGQAVGKIPIDEISPYGDFDPGPNRYSWQLRCEMATALLRDSDRSFIVIDHDEGGHHPILSLEQAVLREHTVARVEHEPAFTVQGFRSLQNLHHHLLKHPLGLGDDASRWPSLLGIKYWSEGILQRLRNAGCPAASDYDGETKVLVGPNPCAPCSTEQKLRCFRILSPLRKAYERATLAAVTQASEKREPRHYHYREGRGRVVVFMDDLCRRVVAKGGGADLTSTTLYQPDYCRPAASNDRDKYFGERRRRIEEIAGAPGGVKICVPPKWGYAR